MSDPIIARVFAVPPAPPRPELWACIFFSGTWFGTTHHSREEAEAHAARDSAVKFIAYIPAEQAAPAAEPAPAGEEKPSDVLDRIEAHRQDVYFERAKP